MIINGVKHINYLENWLKVFSSFNNLLFLPTFYLRILRINLTIKDLNKNNDNKTRESKLFIMKFELKPGKPNQAWSFFTKATFSVLLRILKSNKFWFLLLLLVMRLTKLENELKVKKKFIIFEKKAWANLGTVWIVKKL